jgi:hypothetical protein
MTRGGNLRIIRRRKLKGSREICRGLISGIFSHGFRITV